MRNYILSILLAALSLSACGGNTANLANANSADNANAQPAGTQYADARTAYDEGSKLFDAGKEEASIDAFKQAVALDPDMGDGHFKLALAYALLENDKDAEEAFKKAVDAYKKVLKANPEDPAAHFNLGRAYNKLNKDEEAQDSLTRAVKLKPDDTSYNYELGSILVKLAQYPEAIKHLKKSLELDPENTRAEELLERAEDGRKRVEQGIPAKADQDKLGANKARKSGDDDDPESNANKPANSTPGDKKPAPKGAAPKPPPPPTMKPAGKLSPAKPAPVMMKPVKKP